MKTTKVIIQEIKEVTPQIVYDIVILSSYLYKKSSNKINQKWLEKLLNYPNTNFFIARISPANKIIGMLTLISYPLIGGYQKAWIEGVVVSPEAQGKGVGKELIKAALKRAKKLKYEQVSLTSNPTRIVANKMYQKLKFSQYNTNYYHFKFKE